MSNRAEQAALKAFPKDEKRTLSQRMIINDMRDGYKIGYEQAEKDLALTEDDIRAIVKIHYNLVFKDATGILVGDVAKETLRRFNELKAQEKK